MHELQLNTKKIDDYRNDLLSSKKFAIKKNKQLKILHISNFGNWLFNRLYFISIAKKLSNGFIRSGHDVLDLSDRDIVRYNRLIPNINSYDYLNKQIIETSKNYKPDLILLDIPLIFIKKLLKKLNQKTKMWLYPNGLRTISLTLDLIIYPVEES